MATQRKGSGVDLGTYTPARRGEAPALRDEIDEGLLIARQAVRMAVKNAIVVGALARDERYEERAYAGVAVRRLTALAEENDGQAARMRNLRDSAALLLGKGRHQHDYRAGDVRLLERREQIYTGLAESLRALADDEAILLELVAAARDDAWREVSESLAARLVDPYGDPELDESYARERDDRLRLLVQVDLARLAGEDVPEPAEVSSSELSSPQRLLGRTARLRRRWRRRA